MSGSLYFATAEEMAKLDELAVEHGLEIRQMMELAGFHMLEVFEREGISRKQHVVAVVGKGNKGGDGLCAARHLVNHGWQVSVILLSNSLKPDPQHHLNLLNKMNVAIHILDSQFSTLRQSSGQAFKSQINSADVIIDALIGYNLKGAPYGLFKDAIELVNQSGKKVISYDLPSGIDATTGECFKPCISADATLTLALPKRLFQKKEARERSGSVYLGDIGIPDFLYQKINTSAKSPFSRQQGLMRL